MTDPHAHHYFAGFFSGEGCFAIRERDARFVIKLRRDDRPLVEAFRARFGLGSICNVETPEPWSYIPPAVPLRVDRGYGDARTAYIDVLREWATFTEGPLSCTAYHTARAVHHHWPKRDTIALTFGSWYEALRSAGLESRAARRPSAP